MDVAAGFILARDAQDRTQGLAVQDDDALIAFSDLWNVALGHDRHLPVIRGGLEKGVGVSVFLTEIENPAATAAVQGLDDHLSSLLFHELFESLHAAAHQGRRDQIRKVEGVELLVCFAQRPRMVDDQALPFIHKTQEMSGEKKIHVEGWILAHEDNIKPTEGFRRRRLKLMVRVRPGNGHAMKTPFRYRAADGEIIELRNIDFVASPLGFEHQDKGRVFADVDLFDEVHDDPYL